MPKRPLHSPMTAFLLAVLLAIQPLCTLPVLDLFLGNNQKTAHAAPLTQDAAGSLFLPIILNNAGPGGQGGDAPDFVINSPINGSAVGGVTFFAIQPTNGATIDRVTFRAGSTDLGSDNDAANGFRIFLNARDLPAGVTQLSAIASGPTGQTTKSIQVTIVPNPPQSATMDNNGGVLASESGSVIALLPGSVPAGTTVTVDELTQAETTAQHGVDWAAMGVTFLGAQAVQASAAISGPFGLVASAGFGNQVQPGQAVVNYRLAPDGNGDGAAEVVMVNTASVAPNGDVVADALKQVALVGLEANAHAIKGEDGKLALSAAPGEPLALKLSGLNLYALAGSTAKFRSLVDQSEMAVAAKVDFAPDDPKLLIVRVGLPYLPAGAATLIIENRSTGYASPLIALRIEPLPSLARSAKDVFEEYFQKYLAVLAEEKLKVEQNEQLKAHASVPLAQAIKEVTLAQAAMREAYTLLQTTAAPTVERFLDDAAKMIEVSEILKLPGSTGAEPNACEAPEISAPAAIKKGLYSIIPTPFWAAPLPAKGSDPLEAAGAAAETAGQGSLSALIKQANHSWKIASLQKTVVDTIKQTLAYTNQQSQGKCKEQSPPAPNVVNTHGGSNSTITGMGSAAPAGGNGFGSIAGGSKEASQLLQQPGAALIKIFVNGTLLPFTGMTDAGGYFFVPLIPAGKPFTAVAFDQATGNTRSFKGIGPETGKSVFMFFDFFNEDGSGATQVQIGDVITGEISVAGEVDLYSFTATPGQRVFFDLQNYAGLSSQIDWQLTAPDGAVLFNTCLGCSEPGVKILTLPGTYILAIGDTRESSTGTYRVQLWNVPPPNEFAINIGDVLSDGVPGSGAGRIEVPGAEDHYRFAATAGQRVFFDLQGYQGLSSQVNWHLTAPDGVVIFDTCLGCSEPGVKTLTLSGTYILTVGDIRDDSFGTYRVQLWNVPPPNEFTINIGDVISNGVPGPGAGNIETPGVEDHYRFPATAGQRVRFEIKANAGLGAQVNWRLTAPNGAELFNTCIGCSNPGVQTLAQNGTYLLVIGDPREDSSGTYRLELIAQ